MLLSAAAAFAGASTFPLRWAAADEKQTAEKKQKVLFFTRSVGYEHTVVKRSVGKLSYAERVLSELGDKHGVEVVCTKDGSVFDGDLTQYDCIASYACGNPDEPSVTGAPPITPSGKKRLLAAVAGGLGFVGIHSACYCYYSKPPQFENQKTVDPYVAMLGGEFVMHGAQQKGTMRVAAPDFPAMDELGKSFSLVDEWYGLKNFARDMHVILVQETKGMNIEGQTNKQSYDRPPFPSTWARKQGKGRVFYTAMGHREDVWDSDNFQQVLLGGFAWAMKNVDAAIEPNIDRVTPKAAVLRNS